MEGYVKLPREYMTNGMIQNPDLWQLFCYLMLKASYKEREFVFNDSLVKLKPGQCIIGRKKIAEELNTTESKVRTNLNKLTKLGFLTIQTTNRFSVATLVRWGFEQGDDQPFDQPDNQTLTSHSPDFDHKQESKKERKKENNQPYKEIFDHYIALPNLVTHKKYTESMKKAIAKAMKECGLTMDECKELLDRHNEVVRMTKDEGKYKVEKRGLQDFFGQKAYQSQKLICEEYMEGGVKYEKYLANKTQPQDNERQRELDKERSELMF